MEQFINAKIGSRIPRNGKASVLCNKTTENHKCSRCSFGEKGDHCPQGKLYPACFASERTDKQSVYFPYPYIRSKI